MSWTVGDPSTKNNGLVPPSAELAAVGFITSGSLAAISGGTNPHISSPVSALNACNIPLFAPT